MKRIIKFAAFFLIVMFVFASCKKKIAVISTSPINPPVTNNNQPPVANAGIDVSVALSCSDRTSFALDGSGSSDPDRNIVSYTWAPIYGMQGYILRNPTWANASVENISHGEYAFELTVRDAGGLTSKDSMLISVKGTSKEYDFDITLTDTFSFLQNYNNPWDYGAPTNTGYYDVTSIEGKGIFQPFGEFDIYVVEYADNAALSDIIYSNYIQISQGNVNPLIVLGNFSINLKKHIREGGGSFNGTFTVTSGSAQACNANVFTNLPPLTVTGSLDLTTHTATLRIKGKVYF